MNYECGDVVLVEVVYSEGIGRKKRPALVISSNDYHQGRQEVIIAAITSNVTRILIGDTIIDKWREAGLLYPSSVTAIIQTVKNKMVIRKLGTLVRDDWQRVQANLNISLGFYK